MTDPLIIIPPKSTKTIDSGETRTLVLAYSRSMVRKLKIPKVVRKKLHINICQKCFQECFTKIDYKGETVIFVCEKCAP